MRTTLIALALCAAAGVAFAAPASTPAANTFARMAGPYLEIQAALAGDSIEGVAEAARAVARVAEAGREGDAAAIGVGAGDTAAARGLLGDIARTAEGLEKAADLAAARAAFAGLSEPVVALRDLAVGERPAVAYCPMAKHAWLQADGAVANPYYGSGMLRCGSIIRK